MAVTLAPTDGRTDEEVKHNSGFFQKRAKNIQKVN
jgi:hypothetical protein